jgi:hypothetical protein
MIRAMMVFVHCFLFEGIAFEDGFLVLSLLCLVCCYKDYITIAGLFFFVILFSAVCVNSVARALRWCRS